MIRAGAKERDARGIPTVSGPRFSGWKAGQRHRACWGCALGERCSAGMVADEPVLRCRERRTPYTVYSGLLGVHTDNAASMNVSVINIGTARSRYYPLSKRQQFLAISEPVSKRLWRTADIPINAGCDQRGVMRRWPFRWRVLPPNSIQF